MKKLAALLLALILTASVSLAAAEPVRVIALKGPTAMGMVKWMSEADPADYTFEIAAAIDEVTPKIVQGAVDIAAVPANLASVLYNRTEGAIQVAGINTLGVIYIVENGDSVHSVADLNGQTIYCSGKGATPEYALNYILSANGIDPEKDVQLEWRSEHAECLEAMLAQENGIAMLPQPFVTTAQMKSEGLRVALDLTEEWEKLQADAENPTAMLTGVVVINRAFAQANPDRVSAFLAAYADSVAWVNEHVDDAAELVGQYGIVPAAVAKKAIPACHIVLITGDEMQEKLSGYLGELFSQNPAAVGGKLPAEDFYLK